MLKKIWCVIQLIMDLAAPAVLMLMVLAAFGYFQDGNTLGGFTCVVGSMIPTACIYTHHLREDDVIEEYDEEETE